ncbi:hypothetical protein ACFXO2_28625 [Streptomyces sp. NPDC059152]
MPAVPARSTLRAPPSVPTLLMSTTVLVLVLVVVVVVVAMGV